MKTEVVLTIKKDELKEILDTHVRSGSKKNLLDEFEVSGVQEHHNYESGHPFFGGVKLIYRKKNAQIPT